MNNKQKVVVEGESLTLINSKGEAITIGMISIRKYPRLTGFDKWIPKELKEK